MPKGHLGPQPDFPPADSGRDHSAAPRRSPPWPTRRFARSHKFTVESQEEPRSTTGHNRNLTVSGSTGATSKEEHTIVTPGSAGDWIQALIMAAALAGLAATGRWALGEEEHALSRRPGPPQLPTGLVGATEAAENIEAMH
jgi:hypothetical protein